jgi:hypothetical protein
MLASGLPEFVADDESIARFLTSDSQFNRVVAKPSGFLPGPKDGATSVFRKSADSEQELWETADRELGVERRAKAAAVLTTLHVRQIMLEVAASEPPHGHADIVHWPEVPNDPDATRARQKELALLLSQASVLIRR